MTQHHPRICQRGLVRVGICVGRCAYRGGGTQNGKRTSEAPSTMSTYKTKVISCCPVMLPWLSK